MKRKTTAMICLLMVLFLGLTGCSQKAPSTTPTPSSSPSTSSSPSSSPQNTLDASKDPKVTLSFGGTAAPSDPASIGLQKVADLVHERSGGSITINVFPTSQLGDAMTQMEMLIGGSLDMFMEGSTYMSDFGVPDNGIVSVFFQFNSEQEFLNLLESDLYKSWEDKFQEVNGVRTLAHNWMRPPVDWASNREIKSLDDFKGLKIRSIPSEIPMESLKAIGASPTSVAYNEVYLSLQQGVVEAAIATLDAIHNMKFYEVSKYILMVDSGYVNFHAWMNEAKFKSLTPAQQQILTEVCVEVGEWYSQEVKKMLEGYVKTMTDSGVKLINFTSEDRAKLAEMTMPIIEKKIADGVWSKDLLEKFEEAKKGK